MQQVEVRVSIQPLHTSFHGMGENVMHGQLMDLGNPEDIDKVLLCSS